MTLSSGGVTVVSSLTLTTPVTKVARVDSASVESLCAIATVDMPDDIGARAALTAGSITQRLPRVDQDS